MKTSHETKEKISGCFITYNEEKNIESFLENIKPIVDEIIIVDGYSTDNTVLIAEKFGAKVYKRQFDNYADQRNFGLMKATYKWRFLLDLDEKISPGFVNIVPKLLKSKRADCFKIKIFHYRSDDNKIMTIGWKRVLFKNYGIFWGDLHERAISFRYEKKIYDKDVFVTEYKSSEERYQNYVKYKKMLINLYDKYKKNGQILLMNKLTEYLMPDHNSQMSFEIEDPNLRKNIYINIDSVIKGNLSE